MARRSVSFLSVFCLFLSSALVPFDTHCEIFHLKKRERKKRGAIRLRRSTDVSIDQSTDPSIDAPITRPPRSARPDPEKKKKIDASLRISRFSLPASSCLLAPPFFFLVPPPNPLVVPPPIYAISHIC